MVGCRCSYKNCTNTTKSADNIHFFHYPVKHKERCEVWIQNACKPGFYDLEKEQLRNKIVCEKHFEEKWFLNSQKKRLLQGAIPTLDGVYEDTISTSIIDRDAPVYLPSNQYHDVKVVPANEDGTVFVLDTENMFTISPKIESYIIKNGVLVPTNSNSMIRSTPGRFIKQSTSNRFTKPSTSTAGYVMGAETEIANINTPPGPSNPFNKNKLFEHDCFPKNENIELEVSNEQHLENTESDLITQIEARPQLKLDEEKIVNTLSSKQVQTKPHVTKSYLRQIKKHSRDIASIKRMLKQKRIIQKQKPDMKAILLELQQHLPPSLHTIISLIVGEKNELSEEDVDFFTTIYKGSSQIYQTLSEKYKWNLPSVDIASEMPDSS
ncbi:hypothetical protein ABEB36_011487 [Hypothenemus hampei]|uniref:THAP-type domain-containing protein n=1 Tax=Hypothenemus hampei TaxID=57062 RepID=A0ABD1EFU6_HYPHA